MIGVGKMKQYSNVLNRPLSKGKQEYNQTQVDNIAELERRLEDAGYAVGARVLELLCHRDKGNRRETRLLGILSFVHSTVWKVLFGKLTVRQMKAEMDKTLEWVVPIAANTRKALYGFGWVGDCINTGVEASWKRAGQLGSLKGILKLETLYHANKETTEMYVCRLVVLLHYLKAELGRATSHVMRNNHLIVEDQKMLPDAGNNTSRLVGKSTKDQPPMDLDIDQIKLLDVIDGVDTIRRS